MEHCKQCNGVGKIQHPNAWCNCGSGEGCDIHDKSAISIWGLLCPSCQGTGKIFTDKELKNKGVKCAG